MKGDYKVGVWYLVITMYLWDQTEGGAPIRTIVRRIRCKNDAEHRSGRVVDVLASEGFEAAPPINGRGPWTYRCKAYLAKRMDARSPLGRVGIMWAYVARDAVNIEEGRYND